MNFDTVSCNPKPVRGAVPILVGGHSEAAAKRAGRLAAGFFPSIGSSLDPMGLWDIVRRTAEAKGRDPQSVELLMGCPDALPDSGKDPHAAVEDRIKKGVKRIVVPATAFRKNLEDGLARFGESVIRPFS